MYNEEYDDEQEEQTSDNFFVNFYHNNKVLVWVFLGIIIFILLMLILTKGGSSSTKITYGLEVLPPGDVFVNKGKSTSVVAKMENDPKGIVKWAVGDEIIATVDNGNIKGLNYGKTELIVTYVDPNGESHNETRTIVVSTGDSSIALTDVSFKEGDLFMPLNDSYTIYLTMQPANGYITSEKFYSDNPNVATVDEEGVVRSVGIGSTTITFDVNEGKFRKTLNVYVDEDCNLAEIVVTPQRLSFDGVLRKIEIGQSERLTLNYEPENMDFDKLIWKSEDETIATVENGMVKGISAGTTRVTVSSLNGKNAFIDIEVESDVVDVTDIYLPVNDIYLTVNQNYDLTPIITPDNASNKALTYTSLNESIASVYPNETGTQATITGVSAGTTTLIIRSTGSTTPVEKYVNIIVSGSNGGNSGGNSGNGGSSGGGSDTPVQGFKISSKDAEGKGYVNATYERTKPIDNGAKAPVTITVQKTDSSVDKLVILVCNYGESSSTCGSLGKYETTGTTSFTLQYKGEYVIRVEEYDSKNNKTRTTDKFIWIKEGPEGSNVPTTTIYKTDKTLYNTELAASQSSNSYSVGTTVTFTVTKPDEGFLKVCTRRASTDSSCYKYQVSTTAKKFNFTTAGLYEFVIEKYAKGSSTPYGTDVRYINIVDSSKPTPTPTAPAKVTHTCTLSYNSSTGIVSVTGTASNGSGVRTSEINGISGSSTNAKTSGTYTGKVWFYDNESATCSKYITVSSDQGDTCDLPSNIKIATNGDVTWSGPSNADSYEVRMSGEDDTKWIRVSGNSYNMKHKITAQTGSRRVDVRTVCNNGKTSGYTKSKNVMVYKVKLNRGTGIDSVNGAGNYISGSNVTIDARRDRLYDWVNWTGTATFNTEKTTITNISKDYELTANATKQQCDKVSNVKVYTTGKVTWTGHSNAVRYEIKMSDENNTQWTNVTDTEYIMKDRILATAGSRTIEVRAVCKNSNASANTTKTVGVYTVKLNSGTGIDSINGSGNYISGSKVTIDARLDRDYEWVNWTGTSTFNDQKTVISSIGKNYDLTANAKKK